MQRTMVPEYRAETVRKGCMERIEFEVLASNFYEHEDDNNLSQCNLFIPYLYPTTYQ